MDQRSDLSIDFTALKLFRATHLLVQGRLALAMRVHGLQMEVELQRPGGHRMFLLKDLDFM